MKTAAKRLMAVLLLIGLAVSFVVPATYAENGEENVPQAVTYDFKLYNNEALIADSTAETISGKNIYAYSTKYNGTSRIYEWLVSNYGTDAVNWGIEGAIGEYANTNYATAVKTYEFHGTTDRGMVLRLTVNEGKYAAIRIKVPVAGTYAVGVESSYTGVPAKNLDMYIFPATTDFTKTTVMHDPYSDADTVAEEDQISTYLTAENKVGTVETTAANMSCTVGTKNFSAPGDYIVVFKTGAGGLSYKNAYLSSMTLTPAEPVVETTGASAETATGTTGDTTGAETTAPVETTTQATTEETTAPTKETIDTSGGYIEGYYNFALYEDAAFIDTFVKDGAFADKHYNSGCYKCGKTIANCLAEKYANDQTNWIMEGTSFAQQTFMAKGAQGLRFRYTAGTSADGPDNYVAFRVKVNTPGTYTVTATKDFANQVYNAQVFVFPAEAETMSADALTAAMTDENTVGYLYFPKAAATRQAGEWTFPTAGEYIIALKNVDGSTRMYIDQIALTAVEVEVPKTPVDKMFYDFGLDTIDENFFGTSIFNKYAGTGSVKDKIDEMYAADTLQWKYENRSGVDNTGNQYKFRDDALRFKTAANYKDYDNWWIAFRLDSPGAGTYDVRLTTALAGKAVANVYLIPATKNTMRPEDLQEAMTAENRLVQRAIFDSKNTFYLGEHTFGTANEYVMVLEFTKGTLFYLSSVEMTKDGMVADGTVKKEKIYNGTVYNLALNDAMDGVFVGSKHMVADKLSEMNTLYRSGEINWNYVSISDRMSAGDKPSEYLRFYQATGLRMYGQEDDWLAIKIKSPGSGSFTVSLNYATGYEAGTIAMYVLPADTPKDELWAATDPSNRIGTVCLTNETGEAVIEPGHTSFVGYYNFEAGKEYILLLEVYETSEFASTKCYVNLAQIIMERGIIDYESAQKAKKAKPITVEEALIQIADARSTGAVAEVNGHDYLYLPFEGKVMAVVDLTMGEIVDIVETTCRHPRAIAVGPDGTVWMGSSSKCLAWYDPITQEYNTSPSFINIKGLEMLQQIVYISMSDDGKMLYMNCYPGAYLVSYNIETKEFHNYGQLIKTDDVFISANTYYNGYLYSCYYGYPDPWCKIVKIDPATGKIVDSVDLNTDYFPEGASIARLCVLGDDYLLAGGSGLPQAIVMDINTLELQETSLLSGVHYGTTEIIDGKQYMVVQGLGLHQYDVETKEFSKVPGFGNGGSGFLCHLTPWSKASATIDGELCLVNFLNTGGHPRLYRLESQDIYDWKTLVTGIGGAPDIRAFVNGPEGSNEIYVGFYNSEYCAIYNTEDGKVTHTYLTGGQTDSQIWYEGKLYCGNYSSTTLNEIDLVPADQATYPPTNTFTQRWKLDHDTTGQMRIHCLAAGDGYIFAGTFPNTNLRGGSVTIYNTTNGKWSTKRNVVQDQSILSLAYHDKLLYGTTSTHGGQDAGPAEGTSAVVFVYDYEKEEVLATLDPRDYIRGLPNSVDALMGINPDPKADENGRIWVIVGQGLMCFTFDRETKTFNVQQVIQFHTETIDTSGSQAWLDKNILFDVETNSIYVCLQNYGGFRHIELVDWDAPIGSIKVKDSQRILSQTPIKYVLGEDGDLYYAAGNVMRMLPLNVTDEDWAISAEIDKMIEDLGEITLESEVALNEVRSAYDNLSWRYKALTQNLELLKEKECDMLECKVATLEGVEMTADDYPAMQALMDEYKAMDSRQKRYVKNYDLLKTAYDTASDLNDQKIAAAMQKRIDALKDKFPLTLDDEPEVLEIRADATALTGKQYILLDTTILVDAEAQIAALRAELVKYAEELIQAIPEEITLDAEPAIEAAREVVEKLYTNELKQISYSKFDSADAKLRSLKSAKAAAENVDSLIGEIGIVTLGDKDRIAQARAAYDKLNEAGRGFLTKENKLLRAEFILKALQTWGIPAIVAVDLAAIALLFRKKIFKGKKKEEVEN